MGSSIKAIEAKKKLMEPARVTVVVWDPMENLEEDQARLELRNCQWQGEAEWTQIERPYSGHHVCTDRHWVMSQLIGRSMLVRPSSPLRCHIR